VTIADVLEGELKKDTGPFVLSPHGLVLRRVVIVGFLMDMLHLEDKYLSMTIDDGTGVIRGKAWGYDTGIAFNVRIRTPIRVIGKIRSYEGEVYLAAEMVNEIVDPNELTLHLYERIRGILHARGEWPSSGKMKRYPSLDEIIRKRAELPDTQTRKEEFELPLTDLILEFIREHAGRDGVSILDIAGYFEAREYSRLEINMVVLSLQKARVIEEVRIGRYVPEQSAEKDWKDLSRQDTVYR